VRKVSPPKKKWVNATKAEEDSIVFDSTRERDMYRLLKEAGIPFDYIGGERAKYPIVDSFNYEGESYERAQKKSESLKNVTKVLGAGYTPDFRAKDESWFIEVKGRKLGDFSMRWKLFKQFLSSRTPKPTLFMPVTIGDCKQVIEILKNKRDER
jgi:hypothetical protein